MLSLSKMMESKQTEVFEELGVFFAFSNKQFEERRVEGVEYVNMGMGMVAPKDNADEVMQRLEDIYQECIKQQKEEYTAEEIIEYELCNHECYYTYDITDAYETLKPRGFTYDEVVEVFQKNKHLHYDD